MAELKVVRSAERLSRDEVIYELEHGYKSLSDLERRSGIGRQPLRVLQDKHDPHRKNKINIQDKRPRLPAVSPLPVPEKPKQQPKTTNQPKPKAVPGSPILQTLIGYGCALVAVAFGVVGMIINYRFAYSFGQDALSCAVLGVLGLAIDGANLLLLPVAGALAEQRRYEQCRWYEGWIKPLLAFLIWIPFVSLSTVAALGYAGANVGNGMQSLGKVIEQREDLTAQKKRAESKRNAIKETGDQKILENQMNLALGSVPRKNRDSSKECTEPTLSAIYCSEYNRLKDAYVAAKSRDELDEDIKRISDQIAALPSISSKDPAADQVVLISDGRITADQVGNYRVRGLAIVPGFASILLAFARTLCRR